MKIEHSIEQRQHQTLTMTPQLRQAINLLQLSSQELDQYIDLEIQNNPFLERQEESIPAENDEPSYEDSDDSFDVQANKGSDLIYQSSASSPDLTPSLERAQTKKTLRSFLLEQLNLSAQKRYHKPIGTYLIDHLNAAGYLEIDIAQAAQSLNVPHQQIEDTLTLIQSFEPVGIGARTLRECLALQLKDRGELTPSMQRLIENLDLLVQAEQSKLAKLAGLTWDECKEAIAKIRTLNPKPALSYQIEEEAILIPDVMMKKSGMNQWTVELNPDAHPRLFLNTDYYNEVKAVVKDDSSETFVQKNIRHGSWLLKALQQRAETLIRVSQEIVKYQFSFFEQGEEGLRPLGLKQIAQALDIHESTVSRVTTNKYIATPLGIYELKYFFSSTLSQGNEEEDHASKAVQQRIRVLVHQEDRIKPFSDEQLAHILKAEGISVARRTVTKYRELLNIASSVDRRRLYKLQESGL